MDEGSLIVFQCVCSLFWLFLWGTVGYFLGKKKNIGPVGGVFLSIFCGIIGVLILVFSDDKHDSRSRRRGRRRRPGGRSSRDRGYYDGGGGGRAPDPEADDHHPSPAPVSDFELRFRCPSCDKKFSIQDPAQAGSKARCTKCGLVFRIPEPPE